MPVTTQAFKGWLKSVNNMKLSLDDSVLRLTDEGVNNSVSLSDFDKKSNQDFPNIYNKRIPVIDADASNDVEAEAAISGANTSSISVSRFIVAVNASKHYSSVARVMNPHYMN